jgi:hypothetical protein
MQPLDGKTGPCGTSPETVRVPFCRTRTSRHGARFMWRGTPRAVLYDPRFAVRFFTRDVRFPRSYPLVVGSSACRLIYVDHLQVEEEGLAGQRMVEVEEYGIIFDR